MAHYGSDSSSEFQQGVGERTGMTVPLRVVKLEYRSFFCYTSLKILFYINNSSLAISVNNLLFTKDYKYFEKQIIPHSGKVKL